jgi:predicted dehydrogenase
MTAGSQSLGVVLTYPRAGKAAAPATSRTVRIDAQRAAPAAGRLGVAVVGVANIARWAHMPALRTVPTAEFRAICSASGARAKGFGRRFGAAYCTTDYQTILDDPTVHAVLVATRHSSHASQALAALEAGKHVFVEKPMGLTVKECRQLVAAAQTASGRLGVGFNRRFAPFYRAAKAHLRGRKGPFQINCRVNSPGISGDYWMVDPSQGGAILGEACHFVDLLYWLLEAEPVAVSAVTFPRDLKDPVPENSLCGTIRYADGSIANLTYGTTGTRTSGGERLEIFGPGVGVASQDFKRVEIAGAIRRVRRRLFPDKGYTPQMQAFFRTVAGEDTDMADALDGARATITCLRLLEAAQSGQTVSGDWREALR